MSDPTVCGFKYSQQSWLSGHKLNVSEILAGFPFLHSILYFWGFIEACPKLPALMHLCSFSTDGVKHYHFYYTLEVQFSSLLAPPQL